MSTYPAIRASSTSWRPGADQVTSERGVRFRHSSRLTGGAVALGYEFLTAAEVGQIRSHVAGQRGAMLAFRLSPEAWANHASIGDVFAEAQFRHTGAVAEEHLSAGLANLTVTVTNVTDVG